MPPRRKWTDEDQAQAEKLKAAGWSCRAIGQEIGWGEETVRLRLNPAATAAKKEQSACYRRENREKIRERATRWRQENLEATRERCARYYYDNLEKERNRKARYYRENLEKVRERNARWHNANPETARERRVRWERENPEKRRELTRARSALRRASRRQSFAPLTLAQKADRFALFGDACAYCGTKGKLTVDHVLALTTGGLDEALNVVPACHSCNPSKQAKPVEAWYRRQPFFDETRWRKIQHHCPNASKGQLTLGVQLPSRSQAQ